MYGVCGEMADMAARLKDVAAAAGVSIRTVSNVVNGHPHVKPAVRERVQAAIGELGYQPNMAARQLRQGRTGMIALAVPDLSVPYFAELAGHVLRASSAKGFTLLLEQTEGQRERETELAQGPHAQVVDGLILSPLSSDPEDLPSGARSAPLVLLGERIVDGRFDHVAIDNVAAAKLATKHLLKAGRRRVAAVGVRPGETTSMAGLRLRGYYAALEEAGVATDESLLVATRWFDRQDGYAATQQLLASGARPDALFCFTDLLALGALRALHDAGLSVPGDVAVVGIDDVEEGRFSVPSLTSISPDKAQIAEQAVDLLVSRINHVDELAGRDVSAGFALTIRESAPE